MDRMEIGAFRTRVEAVAALPTIPGVLQKLLAVMENPRLSLAQLSEFVSNDPALASKVLKVVNSPLYGFPGRISSVTQAVILLGLNVVKGLLLGISVFELMRVTMTGLWEHSVGCGIVARIVARKKGLREPEELAVAGMLHDLGKVVLVLQFPQVYQNVLNTARDRGIAVVQAEKALLPAGHTTVGRWIGEKWHFPMNLIEIMASHHRPQAANACAMEAAIVHFSDAVIKARDFGFGGDRLVPIITREAWVHLALSESDIRDVLGEMESCIDSTSDLML